ncbi:MAG: DUF4440 domain-containing protein [Enterobacter sp.]|jgi:hypothetical protein|nr:DUF4440 domain-containing protein [Enterobacter sp.]
MNRFTDEIMTAHVAIESWLGQGQGDLRSLMAHFCEDFTMITPTGACLDYPTLSAIFQAQRGSRSGLHIVVDRIEHIEAWSEGAVLRYRETQSIPGKLTTVRWSTVVLKQHRDKILWRHLHETAQA